MDTRGCSLNTRGCSLKARGGGAWATGGPLQQPCGVLGGHIVHVDAKRGRWGAPWRIFRQFCCFLLFDKINSDVVPILFPHAFADKSGEPKLPKEGNTK